MASIGGMLLAVLNMIPGLSTLITSLAQTYFNSKVQLTQIRVGGDVSVAQSIVTGVVTEGQTRVTFLQTVAGSTFLQLLLGGFAAPIIFFMAKCIVYDTCLGLGTTPELHGQVADYMHTIIYSIFGAGGVMGCYQLYLNHRS